MAGYSAGARRTGAQMGARGRVALLPDAPRRHPPHPDPARLALTAPGRVGCAQTRSVYRNIPGNTLLTTVRKGALSVYSRAFMSHAVRWRTENKEDFECFARFNSAP